MLAYVLALACDCSSLSQVNTKYLRQAGGGMNSLMARIFEGGLAERRPKRVLLKWWFWQGRRPIDLCSLRSYSMQLRLRLAILTESTLAVAQPSLIKGTQNICSPFSETRRIFKIWIFDFYTLLTSVTALYILVLTFCGFKMITFLRSNLSGGSTLMGTTVSTTILHFVVIVCSKMMEIWY